MCSVCMAGWAAAGGECVGAGALQRWLCWQSRVACCPAVPACTPGVDPSLCAPALCSQRVSVHDVCTRHLLTLGASNLPVPGTPACLPTAQVPGRDWVRPTAAAALTPSRPTPVCPPPFPSPLAQPQSPACLPCRPGTFAYSWGSQYCKNCIEGTVAPEGEAGCVVAAGVVAGAGSRACPVKR